MIEKGKQDEGDLEHALTLLAKHGSMQAARVDALEWIEVAKSAMANLPQAPLREMLIDLADYVVARVK